jgi:hypothetical protein
MTFEEWLSNLPPASLVDNYIKLLIYLIVIFTFVSALVVFLATRYYRKKDLPSLLDLDFETDIPTPSDIPPSERIAILNIEKAKSIAAQRALSDAHKKKEVSEAIFGRLSVRYASDVKKIEDEIEKTTREAEVSQLEEELKKMQGDYLSKIKGDEKIEVTPSTPSTAPPTPPGAAPAPPMPTPTPVTPAPTPAAPKPAKPKKEKKKKKGKKAVATPPTPPTPAPTPSMPGKAAPPPPPGVTSTPPGTAVPSPPMPTMPPGAPATTPSIPAPTIPTPKPPGPGAPAPAVAPPAAGEGEGDLFAKSTSIAALRKEMLKELDRLKKFMSEQQ